MEPVFTLTVDGPTDSLVYTSIPLPLGTATPISTPTRKATQAEESENCWPIVDDFRDGKVPNERLVVRQQKDDFYLDFPSGEKEKFADEIADWGDLLPSPDGLWLAGVRYRTKELVIANNKGVILKKIPFRQDWGGLSGWINDHTLILDEDVTEARKYLFALDPFTMADKILKPQYPDINFVMTWPWGGFGLTIYDPTITLVVYPKLSAEGSSLVLWDLTKNGPLTELIDPKGVATFLQPNWDRTGSKFFFPGLLSNPLTVVYRDGTTWHSDIDLSNEYGSIIQDHDWSPDGRYIVFWITKKRPSETEILMIWDTKEDVVFDTCLTDFTEDYHDPNWSLDSKYIAIQTRKPGDEHPESTNQWDILVVDIQDKVAVKVGENMVPTGWLKSEIEQ
jgi:hypothetical protein